MLKLNKTQTIASSFIGSVLALVALLIFLLLPTSDLANSIEHSAKDALWVLVFAPVASLIGSALLVFTFYKDKKVWSNLLAEPIVVGLSGLFAALGIFNFATYLSYTITQFSLGFVAPFSGTTYEFLAVAATMIVILHFIFSILVTMAVARSKKL